ncbi:MAG: rhodanese-like domain-containing protein [Flavobacteriales bacterium]|nr:rhodanese-like domain-containing protein [Flavobacteriales bacterium]
MRSVTPQELKEWMAKGTPHQLVDVREAYEAELCGLGGQLIPMGEILARLDELKRDVPVVVHCRSGNRSASVIHALESRYGFTNLVNLEGGILGYAREVDPTLNCG